MDATRRDALLITSAAVLLPDAAASAQGRLREAGPGGFMTIFHVFATADGASHLRKVTLASSRKALPGAMVMATTMPYVGRG